MVSLLLTNGFECAEALVTLDLLHRAKIDAELVALEGPQVSTTDGIRVQPDRVFREIGQEALLKELDMLVLPGGRDNVARMRQAEDVLAVVAEAARQGKYVAAICAAPWILADLGLTDGKNIVCYPGMEEHMGSANIQAGSKVVVDGRIITGQGAGAVFDFALKLIEILKDQETMERVRHDIHYGDC